MPEFKDRLEEQMHTVLPTMIKPIKQSFIEASKMAKIALEAGYKELPKNDLVRAALQDASNPRNIEKVNVAKGSTPERVYSIEITLKGQPALLTIGVGEKSMVVLLTDRNGNKIEDVTAAPDPKTGKIALNVVKGPGFA